VVVYTILAVIVEAGGPPISLDRAMRSKASSAIPSRFLGMARGGDFEL
jgi:hypothetical protein